MKSAADDEASLSPPAEKTKGKCDLCGKKDGFQGFKLRKCTMCGVCVHETCYLLVPTAHGRPDPDWQCHACAAVGKDVVVSKPGQEIRTHRQDERPADCALCPIVGGEHAMHPLYDTDGSSGTQVILRRERNGRGLPERLAWVHTLCATGTGMNRLTQGCVFGCDADGDYQGDEEDDNDEDDEVFDAKQPARKKSRLKDRGENNGQQNTESDLDSNKDEEGSDNQVFGIHHFVICGKEDGEHTQWSRTVADFRALKCYICGNQGCSPLHIPIQCTKNDVRERLEFKIRHEDKEPCFQPLHVGCAWWGEGNKPRRVFFWPGLPKGNSGENSEPMMEVYCCAHAKKVWQNNPIRQQEFAPRPPTLDRPRRSAPAASPPRRTRPTQERLNGSGRTAGVAPSVPSKASAAAFSRPVSKAATNTSQRRVEKAGRQDLFDEIKEDVVKVIKSAQDRDADVMKATTRCKERWEERLRKDEFKKVWKRVRKAVNAMPELCMGSADNSAENGEVHKGNGKEMHEKSSNLWSTLWMPEYTGGSFDFGSWNTCHEYDVVQTDR